MNLPNRPLPPLDASAVERVVAAALAEDLGGDAEDYRAGEVLGLELLDRDVTSAAVVPEDEWFTGRIVAREAMVVCGLPVADEVWAMLSAAVGLFQPVEMLPLVAEGTTVAAGTPIAEVDGLARAVLAGERTALNVMMLLSGIATVARAFTDAAGPGLEVLDTRKTYPGLRALSKYAAGVGGATNHRMGLYDMVLVKDNHLRRAGGVTAAVQAARGHSPDLLVEVEADTIEQAAEAAAAGADFVLLDNMDDATIALAVAGVRAADLGRVDGERCRIEVSGGVTLERLAGLAALGVDRVSTSALTFARPVDLALDEDAR